MSEAARAEDTNYTLTTQEDERIRDQTPIESGFIIEMFAKIGEPRKENDDTINQ